MQRHSFHALLRQQQVSSATSAAILASSNRRSDAPGLVLQSFLRWCWPRQRFIVISAPSSSAAPVFNDHLQLASQPHHRKGRADSCFQFLIRQLQHVEHRIITQQHPQQPAVDNRESKKGKSNRAASAAAAARVGAGSHRDLAEVFASSARLLTLCCAELFFLLCNIIALSAEMQTAALKSDHSNIHSPTFPLFVRCGHSHSHSDSTSVARPSPQLLLSHPFHLLDGVVDCGSGSSGNGFRSRSERQLQDPAAVVSDKLQRAESQSVMYVLPPEHSRFAGECIDLGSASVDPSKPCAADAAYLVFDAPRSIFLVSSSGSNNRMGKKGRSNVVVHAPPNDEDRVQNAALALFGSSALSPLPLSPLEALEEEEERAVAAAAEAAAVDDSDLLWDENSGTVDDVLELFGGRTDFPLLLQPQPQSRQKSADNKNDGDDNDDDDVLIRGGKNVTPSALTTVTNMSGNCGRRATSSKRQLGIDALNVESAVFQQQQEQRHRNLPLLRADFKPHDAAADDDNQALLAAIEARVSEHDAHHQQQQVTSIVRSSNASREQIVAEVRAFIGRLPLLFGGAIRGEAVLLHRCVELDWAAAQLFFGHQRSAARWKQQSSKQQQRPLFHILPVSAVMQSPTELGRRVMEHLSKDNCRVVVGRSAVDFLSASLSSDGVARASSSAAGSVFSCPSSSSRVDRWWAFQPTVNPAISALGQQDKIAQLFFLSQDSKLHGARGNERDGDDDDDDDGADSAESLLSTGPTGVIPVAAAGGGGNIKNKKQPQQQQQQQLDKKRSRIKQQPQAVAAAGSFEDRFADILGELDEHEQHKIEADTEEASAAQQLKSLHATLWHRVIEHSSSRDRKRTAAHRALVRQVPPRDELQRIVIEFSDPARFAEAIATLRSDAREGQHRKQQQHHQPLSGNKGAVLDMPSVQTFGCDGFSAVLSSVDSWHQQQQQEEKRKKRAAA